MYIVHTNIFMVNNHDLQKRTFNTNITHDKIQAKMIQIIHKIQQLFRTNGGWFPG